MKTKMTLILGLLFSMNMVKAQVDAEALLSLWIDQKYDKLVVKAMKYTEKDDTKNEPLPYLYAAKAFFRISLDESWLEKNEEFKSARREALNYAAKYTKKDKNKTFAVEAEEFFAEMKPVLYEEAMNDFDANNYKKQGSVMKKITEFDPNFVGGYFGVGLNYYGSQNKTEGKKTVEDGLKRMKDLTTFDSYIDADKKFLCYIMYKTAEFLSANREKALAVKLIQAGKSYFENTETEDTEMNEMHKKYQEVYNKLVNG
jgi:hypothetical protein